MKRVWQFMHFLFLVCQILLTMSGQGLSTPCHWMGQITSQLSSSQRSILSNIDMQIPINEDLRRLKVFNMMSSESENISAYKFYILAKVICSASEEPNSVGKALLRIGGGATITISYSSQGVNGKYLMQREFSLDGAAVEMEQSCSSIVCSPAWMVPLPVSKDHHIATVKVSTRGGWHGIRSSKYTVQFEGYLNGHFTEETVILAVNEEISEESTQDVMSSLEPTALYHMPPLILPMFLLGQDEMLIYSTNLFSDFTILQVFSEIHNLYGTFYAIKLCCTTLS
ncbi:hypothetical protein HOLleu_44902 [Holothuria leucospilota]|uniref:Uncharacterized protein n=1 Tax=Holothuria leucospilota TaxID=206669 RepID=A0A9Q0Y8I6_HOLLE|nr:hypothetical protein HOLleu_44902 [Holothuria leucospilota]